ncbi:hypothetical protein RJT34_25621 [Clitoria ternatea]|uniref:Uncharacterized protein n=1 Tax=Clitoria ternatea TaxID=43366 RepID=A0AAN9FQ53_CLITE
MRVLKMLLLYLKEFVEKGSVCSDKLSCMGWTATDFNFVPLKLDCLAHLIKAFESSKIREACGSFWNLLIAQANY